MDVAESYPIPNTFGLISQAEYGCRLQTPADVIAAIEFARDRGLRLRVVGAGSNVVPLPRVRGVVAVMSTPGIRIVEDGDEELLLEVGAGENWHQLVMHCVDRGWNGIENLALIPGSVGAAPVQNIGAYGVELCDVLDSVQIVDEQQQLRWLTAEECEFGYRNSLFQRHSELIIVAVRLRLSKVAEPRLGYPDLAAYFGHSSEVTARQVADAVISIRSAKLPNPDEHPNAGSFFKNPVIDAAHSNQFRNLGLSVYATDAGVKLSAAELIDRCGWKEQPTEYVRCWSKQPLVLVSQNRAKASHILSFANDVRASVASTFGIQLELEPSVLS